MLNYTSKFIVGDLITLAESLPIFPYKKKHNIDKIIEFKDIFNSSPHLDEDFSGWILSGEKLVLLDIIYLEEIPAIYECLLGKEIVCLFKTKKIDPEVCFVKCKS